MRILMASNYQPPHMGGIEFAAEALKQCWEQDGHTVTWITTDVPRKARPSTPDNVRLPALNFMETLFEANTPLILPTAMRRIRRLVAEHDAVNVHSLAPTLASSVLKAALEQDKPTVVTQHVGVIPLPFRPLNGLQEIVIRRSARRVVQAGAPLTFVGEAVRQWFLDHAGIRPEQVYMTPAGINQDDYYLVTDAEREKIRTKWDLHARDFNVLFVGRFYEKKGLPLMRELVEACPEIHFSFVGSGPLDPRDWGAVNVEVFGFLSTRQLRELYGAHDLFIMPSVGEGWPAVVPQAMACGLPCLVSPETFEGFGRDPELFLVIKRDVRKLAHALKEAAAGRMPLVDRRHEVADYARAEWDWLRTARIYIDLFRKIFERKQASHG